MLRAYMRNRWLTMICEYTYLVAICCYLAKISAGKDCEESTW
jgi:hypothetical protein